MLRLWVAIGDCSVETVEYRALSRCQAGCSVHVSPRCGDDSSKAVGCACVVPTGMCLSVDLDPSG